jgi:hypothetical protein
VAGSGDAGPFNNIGSLATTPGVISVGATTTYRVYVQTVSSGAQFGVGGWEDNNITALSSDGITEFNPHTVNVVAPGDGGWSLCSTDTAMFGGCLNFAGGPTPVWAAGGTSASAAATSGTAALVMQAYAHTHGGALPSPALVERIIVSTATDLGAPARHQGAGLVNALKAVQLAESIGTSSHRGRTLLVSKTSLNATVNAGKKASFTVSVTNEGTRSQKVTPNVSGRPTTVSSDTGTVTLSSASPHFLDVLGASSGSNSAASLAASEIAPGIFFAFPEATGPFTSGTTGTVNLAAVARTNPFDSAVTSTSGDGWGQSVNPSAPYSPLTLKPGQTATITLTITPNAPKGTVIHGFISVDTFNGATASGDELIKIPYSYKVG